MTMRPFESLALLLIVLGTARGVEAQTAHAAPQALLDAAVDQRVTAVAADREAVLRVLSRPEVKDIANRAGITLRTRETAVARLEGEDLTRAAALARQAEDNLAGGATAAQWGWYLLGIAIVPLILVVAVLSF